MPIFDSPPKEYLTFLRNTIELGKKYGTTQAFRETFLNGLHAHTK